ncbi:hypothetical protein HY642_00470 [Candidatus Woesearchaeota archaeon]|nr:hypothetical protein [Candidatus Woesearchaeota archaeon]
MALFIEMDGKLEAQLREQAMKRYGYGKGSLKEAVTAAVAGWLASRPTNIEPLPLSAFAGVLRHVKKSSVQLKHEAAALFT